MAITDINNTTIPFMGQEDYTPGPVEREVEHGIQFDHDYRIRVVELQREFTQLGRS